MKKIIKIPTRAMINGGLEYGILKDAYDENNNALDQKTFEPIGKLLFTYESIKSMDSLKFDSDKIQIDLKIKVLNDMKLKSKHIIKTNSNLYQISYMDYSKDKKMVYLFLTKLKDTLDKHIELYIKDSKSPFEEPTKTFYRKVWANVNESYIKKGINAEKETFIKEFTIIFKFDKKILELEKNNVLNKLLIHFENESLVISNIEIIDKENSLYKIKANSC